MIQRIFANSHLILAGCFAAVFYAGFKAGNRFKTLREMVNAMIPNGDG